MSNAGKRSGYDSDRSHGSNGGYGSGSSLGTRDYPSGESTGYASYTGGSVWSGFGSPVSQDLILGAGYQGQTMDNGMVKKLTGAHSFIDEMTGIGWG